MSSSLLHIVSHGPHCLDGVAAAAAVARFHEGRPIDVKFASNREVNDVLRSIDGASGDDLWITDISWNDPATEAHLARLAERGVAIHWFDHHKTAIERLARGGFRLAFTTRVVTDDFAASKLVYDYLNTQARSLTGRDAPRQFTEFAPLVAMADDNDRWLHRIAGSRELGLVLRAMPAGEAYRSFLALDESLTDTPAMAEARTRIREELDRNRRLAEATRVEQQIGDVRLVAAVCDGYAGEIADEWGRSSPRTVFALWDVRSQSLSFRRSPDHGFDLSRLAESLGGGGHPAAAGATIDALTRGLGSRVLDHVAGAVAACGSNPDPRSPVAD